MVVWLNKTCLGEKERIFSFSHIIQLLTEIFDILTLFSSFSVSSIFAQSNIFLIAENDICKLFFLGLRIILFHNTAPLQSSGIIDGESFYSVFLVLYANSENTLKVVYRCWRLRQKYLIVFGEWAHSVCGSFSVDYHMFYRQHLRADTESRPQQHTWNSEFFVLSRSK